MAATLYVLTGQNNVGEITATDTSYDMNAAIALHDEHCGQNPAAHLYMIEIRDDFPDDHQAISALFDAARGRPIAVLAADLVARGARRSLTSTNPRARAGGR
jgi:hypothetical protein